MTDSEPTKRALEDVVRAAAAEARAKEVERERLQQSLHRPKGTTPAARNEVRRDAIVRGALPENAAGSLQRLLDRNLEILYGEFGLTPAEATELLAEFRDPGRGSTTPVQPRVATALANLSEIVAACEEPETAEAARFVSHTGDSSEALISGRVSARRRTTARQKGASKRRVEATERHQKMVEYGRNLLATGTEAHEVASKVAKKFASSPRTAREALQAAEVLLPRRAKKGKSL